MLDSLPQVKTDQYVVNLEIPVEESPSTEGGS